MVIDFKCDAVIGGFPGGIVKVLMTSDEHPRVQPEVMLLNVLPARGEFQVGAVYELTLRKKG